MLEPLLLCSAFLLPQGDGPQDRPQDGRPAARTAARTLSDRQRMVKSDWGDDAPGKAVLPSKFLPLVGARYVAPERVKDRVGPDDLVIGVLLGGRPVAYPVNMLGAPHREVLNDEQQGVAFSVSWCPLAFTGAVHTRAVGEDRTVTLGVSGRLHGGNLMLWDQETGSLWSQLRGEALYGEHQGHSLDQLPALVVGLGTWRRMHPDTTVLDMSTVPQQGFFFTTDDLAHGEIKARDGVRALGVGLRNGTDTLVVPLKRAQQEGTVQVEVGGVPLIVVWVAGEKAALVYERRRDDKTLRLSLKDGALTTTYGTLAFDPLTGASVKQDGGGEALRRFPFMLTCVGTWQLHYPKGRTHE